MFGSLLGFRSDGDPIRSGIGFYTNDYGWYWVSEGEEAGWGLVTFHYGHWVYDDEFGWMWIPGTEWGPGWVQWRRGDGYVGWAPLPPEVGYSYGPDLWVFVRERDVISPYIAEVVLPPDRVYFQDSVVVSRAEFLDRGYAVNWGIPPETVAAVYGRPIPEYRVHPGVIAGTRTWPGAVVVRREDIRNPGRLREFIRQSVIGREVSRIAPGVAAAPRNGGRVGEAPQRGAFPRAGARNPAGEFANQERRGQERRQDVYSQQLGEQRRQGEPSPRREQQRPGTTGAGPSNGHFGEGFGREEPTRLGPRLSQPNDRNRRGPPRFGNEPQGGRHFGEEQRPGPQFGPRVGAGPGQRLGGEQRAFQGPALRGEQRGFQGPGPQQHVGPGAFGPRPGAIPGQGFGGEQRAFEGAALRGEQRGFQGPRPQQRVGPGAFRPGASPGQRFAGEQRAFQGSALQHGAMGAGRMPSTTGMAPRGGRGGRE